MIWMSHAAELSGEYIGTTHEYSVSSYLLTSITAREWAENSEQILMNLK